MPRGPADLLPVVVSGGSGRQAAEHLGELAADEVEPLQDLAEPLVVLAELAVHAVQAQADLVELDAVREQFLVDGRELPAVPALKPDDEIEVITRRLDVGPDPSGCAAGVRHGQQRRPECGMAPPGSHGPDRVARPLSQGLITLLSLAWVRGAGVAYGYIGSMRARPGHRDDVIEILLSGSDGLRAAGCQVYAVCTTTDNPDLIVVTEVWDSAAAHDASLQLPETRAAIGQAMPMLTGEFTRQELTVVGGLGVAVHG
jgi:quinol monooxygenase YgiN